MWTVIFYRIKPNLSRCTNMYKKSLKFGLAKPRFFFSFEILLLSVGGMQQRNLLLWVLILIIECHLRHKWCWCIPPSVFYDSCMKPVLKLWAMPSICLFEKPCAQAYDMPLKQNVSEGSTHTLLTLDDQSLSLQQRMFNHQFCTCTVLKIVTS